MGSKVRRHVKVQLEGEDALNSLSENDAGYVRLLCVSLGIPIDNLRCDIGTDMYRQLARKNGQLDLFGNAPGKEEE